MNRYDIAIGNDPSIKTLFIKLFFDIKDDSFKVESNIKAEHQEEIILECLRSQMGAGSDRREPAKRDDYTISVILDLETDTFKVIDDCHNDSLATGILMHYTKKKPS